MDANGGGTVDRADFLSHFLVRMGKVEQGDVVKLNAMFTALDTNSAGRVDVAVLVARAGAVARAGPARAEPALLSRANSSDAQPDSPPPCSDSSSTDHLEPGGFHLGSRGSSLRYNLLGHPERVHPVFRPLEAAAAIAAASALQMGRAYSSALQYVAVALEEATTPRAVDAVLAAAGGGGAMALLHGVDYTGLMPTRLFAPPMLGSAIVLFGGPAPPPPGMLLLSSMGAFCIGTALHHSAGSSSPAISHCLVAALLLLWFKLSRVYFLPAAGFAALLAQSHHAAHHAAGGVPHGHSPAHAASAYSALLYLICPWGAGHVLLYAAAAATARFRLQVRAALTREFRQSHISGEARLREIFERFDSSGDGRLDHLELKLAIRLAAGDEVPLTDCERIVRALDTDGNGALDFHEFKQALAECSRVSLGNSL